MDATGWSEVALILATELGERRRSLAAISTDRHGLREYDREHGQTPGERANDELTRAIRTRERAKEKEAHRG